MFTVPAPPAPSHPGAPGSALPSAPSFSPPALPTSSPKQLAVRTRSIGTNTQDGGGSGALEGESTCLGPCQPGTSVNLEGIVWHETEEGKESVLLCPLLRTRTPDVRKRSERLLQSVSDGEDVESLMPHTLGKYLFHASAKPRWLKRIHWLDLTKHFAWTVSGTQLLGVSHFYDEFLSCLFKKAESWS